MRIFLDLKHLAMVGLLFCALAFAHWASGQEPPQKKGGLDSVVDSSQAPPPEAEVSDDPKAESEPTSTLPLEERVAQLMLVTLKGTSYPTTADQQFIREFPPGGVIISLVTRPENAAEAIIAIRAEEAALESDIPFFIGTNLFSTPLLEDRPGSSYLPLPSLLSLAAGGASDTTAGLANNIAEDLATMGFNLHIGPSLDLASRLPTDNASLQSLGDDPLFISSFAVQLAERMNGHNILWVPLGFPGGGQNREHSGPAVLLTPRSQLRSRDLLPYEKAINSGVEMVHVGNTLVPTLDRSVPASLSATVHQDLLRDILEFEGLIVAGPMDDPYITTHRDSSVAALEALLAGADMIYWNDAGPRVIRAIGTITQAVRSGKISEAFIDHAYERIVEVKRRHGLLERPVPEKKLAARIERRIGKREDTYEIERRAVTLVKNELNVLPLTKEDSHPIGVTGVRGVLELHEALEEYIKPISRQRIGTARHATRIESFEIDRIMKVAQGARTFICIFSDDVATSGQAKLLRELKTTGAKVVVILIGHPRKLPSFAEADAILLAYANPESVDSAMRAVADVLVGNAPIDVLPPLRDLRVAAGQEMAFDVYSVIRSPVGRLPLTLDATFTAGHSISYRPTLSLKRVRWDFGDGTASKDFIAPYAYTEPGRYNIVLTVEDDSGATSVGTFPVLVE